MIIMLVFLITAEGLQKLCTVKQGAIFSMRSQYVICSWAFTFKKMLS